MEKILKILVILLIFEDYQNDEKSNENYQNIIGININKINFGFFKNMKANAALGRKATSPNCIYLDYYTRFESYNLASDTYFNFSSLGCSTFQISYIAGCSNYQVLMDSTDKILT